MLVAAGCETFFWGWKTGLIPMKRALNKLAQPIQEPSRTSSRYQDGVWNQRGILGCHQHGISPKGQDESRRKVLAVDWPAGIYGLRSKNRKGLLSLVHGGAALDASFHGWPSSAQPFHGGEWTCFIHKKYTDLTKLISENVLLWCCPSFFQDTPFFFSQGFYSQKH